MPVAAESKLDSPIKEFITVEVKDQPVAAVEAVQTKPAITIATKSEALSKPEPTELTEKLPEKTKPEQPEMIYSQAELPAADEQTIEIVAEESPDLENDPIIWDLEGPGSDEELESEFIVVEGDYTGADRELTFEVIPEDIINAVEAETKDIEKELYELFEPLESEELIFEAQALSEMIITETLAIAGEQINPEDAQAEILNDELAEAEIVPQAKLEVLCERLFDILDIHVDEETVREFIRSITLENVDLSGIDLPDDLETGTHEQKLISYLLVRNLSLLTKQKTPSFVLLGKYALISDRLAFAAPF